MKVISGADILNLGRVMNSLELTLYPEKTLDAIHEHLRQTIPTMGVDSKLYRLLKEELSKLGYWKGKDK